jgi:hypothetical protein
VAVFRVLSPHILLTFLRTCCHDACSPALPVVVGCCAWQACESGKCFTKEYPDTPAAAAFTRVVEGLVAATASK